MVDLNAVYAKDENIVSRLIDTEYILVPIRQNTADLQAIYTLEGVGVRVWELIDGQRTLEDIKQRILDEYEVEPGAAERDLFNFIQELESINCVRKA